MIDEEILDTIRRNLPPKPFRTADLAFELRMKPKKLAFALSILKRLGEVHRFEVYVVLGGVFRTTRSFWRKNA